jgi:hypothetical protein
MLIWLALLAALSAGQALAQEQAAPAAATAASPASGGPDNRDSTVDGPLICFSAREMSDRVARLRLVNPLMTMQANARRLRADPLRTRLCRSGTRLIYELSLIRRDGKVAKVYVNAQNGRVMASPRN